MIRHTDFKPTNICKELLEVIEALPTFTFTTVSKFHFIALLNSPASKSDVAILLFKEYQSKLHSLVNHTTKIEDYISEIENDLALKEHILGVSNSMNDPGKRAKEENEWKDARAEVVVYVKDLEEANRIDLNGKLPKSNDIHVKIAEIPYVEECVQQSDDIDAIPDHWRKRHDTICVGRAIGVNEIFGTLGAILLVDNQYCILTCEHGFMPYENLYHPNSENLKYKIATRKVIFMFFQTDC